MERGIITGECRANREAYLALEKPYDIHDLRVALNKLTVQLSKITDEVKLNARRRWTYSESGVVSLACAYISRDVTTEPLLKSLAAREIIKASMLKIDSRVSTVSIEEVDEPCLFKVTVYFNPPLT